MKRRTKITFGLALIFLAIFIFGITETGQHLLMGEIPKDVSHWQLDDLMMGAGLAPWVYGLLPFLVLFGLAIGLLWSDLTSGREQHSN